MLTVDSVVANAPNAATLGKVLLCVRRCIPPSAVVPLIAFVTAIEGLCNACGSLRSLHTEHTIVDHLWRHFSFTSVMIFSSLTVVSTFPPFLAARSTVTLSTFIWQSCP